MFKTLLISGLIFSLACSNSYLTCKVTEINKKLVQKGNIQRIDVTKDKIILYKSKENLVGYSNKALSDVRESTSYTTSDGNTSIVISDSQKTVMVSRSDGFSVKLDCDRYNDDYYKNDSLSAEQIGALDKMSTDSIVKYIVTEGRKNLPVKLDALTQLVKISTGKNTIKYVNTLDINNKAIDEMWKSLPMREKIQEEQFRINVQTTCGTPVANYLILKRNIVYLSEYLDLSQRSLFTHETKKEDCLKENKRKARSSKKDIGFDSIIYPLQKKLPMKIDSMTTLISVSSSGNEIRYVYSLNEINNFNFDLLRSNKVSVKEDRVKATVSSYCSKAYKRKLLEDGAIINYVYMLGDMEPYFEFQFSLKDCEK